MAEKQCSTCKKILPIDCFAIRATSQDGRRGQCNECRRSVKAAWYAPIQKQKAARRAERQSVKEKACIKCGVVKPISDYLKTANGGIRDTCNTCVAIAAGITRKGQTQKSHQEILQSNCQVCRLCQVRKPLDNFGRLHGNYKRECKQCLAGLQRVAYIQNFEKHRCRAAEYASRNPEKVKTRKQIWHARNKDERKKYMKSWHKKNAQHDLKYRQTQKERIRLAAKAYCEANPDKVCAKASAYRARKANAPKIEQINRKAIIERDKGTCYLCGQVVPKNKIHLDHIVPLSKGGNHTADNLKVACATCNTRKNAKPLDKFKEQLKSGFYGP